MYVYVHKLLQTHFHCHLSFSPSPLIFTMLVESPQCVTGMMTFGPHLSALWEHGAPGSPVHEVVCDNVAVRCGQKAFGSKPPAFEYSSTVVSLLIKMNKK